VTRPEIRYARVGDEHVAYQVVGHGALDVVLIPAWFSNVEAIWDLVPASRFLERLASFCRLLLFDRRGTGLSDPAPVSGQPFFEQSTDDLIAVLDAAGSERAAFVGCDGGGPVAMLAAGTHPRRVTALVLVNSFARMAQASDYPAGAPPHVLDGWLTRSTDQWNGDAGFALNAPSVEGNVEMASQFTRFLRMAASPGVAYATRQVLHALDVRDMLPSIQAPTLVIHRRGDRMIRVEHGRYLAEHIAGARLVELPGDDHLFYFGDTDAIVAEIEVFLTGVRHVEVDRALATVLFTDIVGSTRHTATVGDRRWRETLDEHDRAIEQLVVRFQGVLIKTTGDGVLATFDGPGRAVRCAIAIRDAVRPLGLEVRAGLHIGEVERRGDDITGMAVVIGRRVCDLAGPGEIVVSRTVTDLVVGSGLTFADRGSQALKGVPGEWQLFTVSG
jgi:pimeloyl-ACP methyl ester carboxylesterase/class 3 adenylate cyclase